VKTQTCFFLFGLGFDNELLWTLTLGPENKSAFDPGEDGGLWENKFELSITAHLLLGA
jgi:hypothetical protein